MVETRIREADFEGVRIFVLSGEDIVVFKIIFNRPHDWRDVERVFQRMGESVDLDYVYHWLSEILGDDDSRIERLRRDCPRRGEADRRVITGAVLLRRLCKPFSFARNLFRCPPNLPFNCGSWVLECPSRSKVPFEDLLPPSTATRRL